MLAQCGEDISDPREKAMSSKDRLVAHLAHHHHHTTVSMSRSLQPPQNPPLSMFVVCIPFFLRQVGGGCEFAPDPSYHVPAALSFSISHLTIHTAQLETPFSSVLFFSSRHLFLYKSPLSPFLPFPLSNSHVSSKKKKKKKRIYFQKTQ